MSAITFSSAQPLFQQLMMPLQSVVNFFSPPVNSSSIVVSTPAFTTPSPIRQTRVGSSICVTARAHPSQVLRSRRAQDGRIVISGRMRDVCAELDRLCDD
jgi:hypothetical protein